MRAVMGKYLMTDGKTSLSTGYRDPHSGINFRLLSHEYTDNSLSVVYQCPYRIMVVRIFRNDEDTARFCVWAPNYALKELLMVRVFGKDEDSV